MSHQDAVTKMPKYFTKIASTKNSPFTIIENIKENLWDTILSRSYSYRRKRKNNI